MNTARIRSAFRYPSEDNDQPEEMDEEQQERLIADLQQLDTNNSRTYRWIFSLIPLTAAVYLLVSLSNAGTAKEGLIDILSASSLTATCYILLTMPLKADDKKGKKPVYLVEMEKSSIQHYVLYLDASLVAMLSLASMLSWYRDDTQQSMKQALPAVMFTLTMFVREQLRPLQLQELQQARYDLKGA